jgi:hypothetical protein
MRSKSEKVYTLAQVAKMLRKGTTTVYNYANGGLIELVPGVVSSSGKQIKAVSEAEFARLKRDGVDPSGLRDELAKRGFSVKPTKKKPVKRGASKTAAKSAVKKSVKRKAVAVAASVKTAKKRGKR